MKKAFQHIGILWILTILGLTNCLSFEKSSLWMNESIDLNTKQDPKTYDEAKKLEYKNYRTYRRSLKNLHEKKLLEQIRDDKSLDSSIDASNTSSK